ncbi:MAG: hypothetical protein ACOCP1_03185 [Campylobacterales bacterium]
MKRRVRGFGKKYFTLASIQAYSSGAVLDAYIISLLSKSIAFSKSLIHRTKKSFHQLRLLVFALLFISLVHNATSKEEDGEPP